MITIVCVLRAGGKVGYDATWVDKLYNMVKRNTTIPFKFVCLTDVPINHNSIPLLPVGSGYWAKMQLFRSGLFAGPTLYLDLDTIVAGSLNPIIEILMAQDKFVMWQDPDYKISSSAIMYWSGDQSYIFDTYLQYTDYFENLYSQENQGVERQVGDQALISRLTDHVFINDLVLPEWIQVLGKNNSDNLDQCRLLIFRKNNNKPSNKLDHPLVKEHWH